MSDTDVNTEFIAKVERSKLFPCPLEVDELEVDSKCTQGKQKNPPRWMNSYIVFRRALGLLLKGAKMDGKQLTLLARKMWNESSECEKEEYKNISLELRERHRKRYPEFDEDVCLKPYCELNFDGFDDNGLNEDYSQPSIGPSNYPFYQGELIVVPQYQLQNNELYSFPYVEFYFGTQCSLTQLHEDFVRENTICR